jgi:hypothetical protein
MLAALSQWKLIGLGFLALLLAVQTVRLGHAENKVDKLRIDLNEARAELKRISTKKNEQAERTGGNIKKAEAQRDKAKVEAEKIEQAPTAPNCETPVEIMGADI